MITIPSPHPYFGSKAAAADLIWQALGDPGNFVDATCGSNAVLYARPRTTFDDVVETINDAWGFIPNFLRAVREAPEDVAIHADWPVSELDMHARHTAIVKAIDGGILEKLRDDPEFFDAKIAGWWVWGQSIWIGSGWCDPNVSFVKRNRSKSKANESAKRLPYLQGAGQRERDRHPHYGRGIFRRQLPSPGVVRMPGDGDDPTVLPLPRRLDVLMKYFKLISARIERTRISCGDWTRVVAPTVTTSHGLTGIVLDPPYGPEAKRTMNLYALDSENIARDMRAWCAEHGSDPHLRIVLCGYEGEHEELLRHDWSCIAWRGKGGMGNHGGENANADRERLWLSPYCIGGTKYNGPLFGSR